MKKFIRNLIINLSMTSYEKKRDRDFAEQHGTEDGKYFRILWNAGHRNEAAENYMNGHHGKARRIYDNAFSMNSGFSHKEMDSLLR